MSNHFGPFCLQILPRATMTWEEFLAVTPCKSIALDGVVRGGPNYDRSTRHINFDHHDGVVREATMSTAMQVYFALKGGLMEAFGAVDGYPARAMIYINDTDQDTAFAVWLLLNYKKFEGTQTIPHMQRLLALNDRWDITGGAFQMNLDDQLVRQHTWVFKPYTDLRKTGGLAQATEQIMRDNLEAVMAHLNRYMMGQGEEVELDTRHEILFDSPAFKIVDEIGGNEARYHLYSKGMNAFVSLVARRNDGRFVYSIGRRSQFIPFPIEQLYDDLNAAEGLNRQTGWNGSTIIGGSSRVHGSRLGWEEIRDIVNARIKAGVT